MEKIVLSKGVHKPPIISIIRLQFQNIKQKYVQLFNLKTWESGMYFKCCAF